MFVMTPATGDALGATVCALHPSSRRQVPGASPKVRLTATSLPGQLMMTMLMTVSFFSELLQDTGLGLSPSTTASLTPRSGDEAPRLTSTRQREPEAQWGLLKVRAIRGGQGHTLPAFLALPSGPFPTPIPQATAESLPCYLGSLLPPRPPSYPKRKENVL